MFKDMKRKNFQLVALMHFLMHLISGIQILNIAFAIIDNKIITRQEEHQLKISIKWLFIVSDFIPFHSAAVQYRFEYSR